MLNITPLARFWLTRQARFYDRCVSPDNVEEIQRKVLAQLIQKARSTSYGRLYNFDKIRSYRDFAKSVPVVEYPEIRQWIERMVFGEKDVLWPGYCRRFAQSSGTSDGKSKYIPITDQSLRSNHYPGASLSLAFYLKQVKDSKIFSGKSFILGGSYANEISHLPKGVRVGDLSASLIDCINPVVNLVRVPSKKIALMADWTEKLPALVKASIHQNITNISGVPSWFLTVLKNVINEAGASTIHDVWPNLEVFFHGGIAFGPYKEQYRQITDPAKMHYQENYNASEGFFATQDSLDVPAMRLLLNIGVFYEFIPLDQIGQPFPKALPPWEVEPGKTYALIITACNGLWRYAIGDTVEIQSINPLRIKIAGRTKCFINAFGEELMVHNADTAIVQAARETNASVADFTAGPVFASGNRRGHHRWLIEWNRLPDSIDRFAECLDKALQGVNSDYQAKRSGNLFLDPPQIISAEKGTFDRWLASTGKLGGQRKVPRLSNDPTLIDNILSVTNHEN